MRVRQADDRASAHGAMSLARMFAATAAAGLLLSACATTPPAPPAPIARAPTAQVGLSVDERMTLAVELLNHDNRENARVELLAIIATAPDNIAAPRLLREMDEDAQAMLGPQNFAYTVRLGETLETIAARFLGDPLRFYILARYNGIAAPASIVEGQVLMIPGAPPRKAPPRRTVPPPPTVTATTPAPQAARARTLRTAALENMNRGRINRAVGLLEQAAQVDPGNPLIRRDLARAQRIQARVNGR
jgi:hypothetical protein